MGCGSCGAGSRVGRRAYIGVVERYVWFVAIVDNYNIRLLGRKSLFLPLSSAYFRSFPLSNLLLREIL